LEAVELANAPPAGSEKSRPSAGRRENGVTLHGHGMSLLLDYITLLPRLPHEPDGADSDATCITKGEHDKTNSAPVSPQYPPDGARISQFTSSNPLNINVKLRSYDKPNVYKELWVDVGGDFDGVQPILATASDGGSTTFAHEWLLENGPGGEAEFGPRLFLNPFHEEVELEITPVPGGWRSRTGSTSIRSAFPPRAPCC
jgi:hypothetical protein